MVQHKAGWLYCEEEKEEVLAEFDFVELQLPFFVFKVRLLTRDQLVSKSIFNRSCMEVEAIKRFFLLNKESAAVIGYRHFMTTDMGNDQVALADRRPYRGQ